MSSWILIARSAVPECRLHFVPALVIGSGAKEQSAPFVSPAQIHMRGRARAVVDAAGIGGTSTMAWRGLGSNPHFPGASGLSSGAFV